MMTVPICDSFASWFVEGHSCYVELDISEVIMNKKVVPVEESPRPDISIQVYDHSSKDPVSIHLIDNRRVVYVDSRGDFDESEIKYILKLDVPHITRKEEDFRYQHDLQYVMDIKDATSLIGEINNTSSRTNNKQKMNAEFTKRKGCKKKRSHGRIRDDDSLSMKINIPRSVFRESNNTEDVIEVIAGWACGYESVKLTHPVIFLPSASSTHESEL